MIVSSKSDFGDGNFPKIGHCLLLSQDAELVGWQARQRAQLKQNALDERDAANERMCAHKRSCRPVRAQADDAPSHARQTGPQRDYG
jgi:hypothetical protein